MRLTAELIRSAPSYLNPLKERELGLRGYKIPAIENLGVTEDVYDAIDLSDNEIIKLDNFPLLTHLATLLLSNNRIAKIGEGLNQFIPKLASLIMTNNKMSSLSDLRPLQELKKLRYLSLLNNPVTKQSHYRLYVIHLLPSLLMLDFQKVKPAERQDAISLYGSEAEQKKNKKGGARVKAAAGTKASSERKEEETKSNTFTPGEMVLDDQPSHLLTPVLKKKLLEKIKNATSLTEIDRLEKIVASGRFYPSDLDLITS